MIRALRAARPEDVGFVAEWVVAGFVGRWFRRRGWLGFTLPLPAVVVIFYWSFAGEGPDPLVRVHEMQHARQARRHGWLSFSARYLWALRRGYRENPFEVEAWAVEAEAARCGLPVWARSARPG